MIDLTLQTKAFKVQILLNFYFKPMLGLPLQFWFYFERLIQK